MKNTDKQIDEKFFKFSSEIDFNQTKIYETHKLKIKLIMIFLN